MHWVHPRGLPGITLAAPDSPASPRFPRRSREIQNFKFLHPHLFGAASLRVGQKDFISWKIFLIWSQRASRVASTNSGAFHNSHAKKHFIYKLDLAKNWKGRTLTWRHSANYHLQPSRLRLGNTLVLFLHLLIKKDILFFSSFVFIPTIFPHALQSWSPCEINMSWG